jgi:hypothetical protein
MSEVQQSALERAREASRLLREQGIAPERLDPIEKARRNPKSLRMAINAKCWDCMGGMSDPGIRERIGACSLVACSLNPVRPYQRGQEDEG